MTAFDFLKPGDIFIEIGHSSLKARHGQAGIELPIERQSNGNLTGACKGKLTLGLREFLGKKTGLSRLRALCAISSRGVSLRPLTLPPSTQDNLLHQSS